MSSHFIDPQFKQGWVISHTGDGSTSVTDGVLKTTGTGSASARRDFWIPAQGGQVVEFEVLARSLTGISRIAIDHISANGADFENLDYVEITKDEWSWHKIKVVVPHSTTRKYIRVVLGKWSSMVGTFDAEYRVPVLETKNDGGGINILACGLLRIVNGVPALEWNGDIFGYWRQFGIKSLAYDSDDKAIIVNLEAQIYDKMRPQLMASGTTDQVAIPVAGKLVAGSNSSLKIKFTDGTQFIDIGSGTYYANIFVFI